jgi:hypothetical protein
MYVLLTQTRTVISYMMDPSFRQRERPTDKQNLICLGYNQNMVMSPRGAQRQDSDETCSIRLD